MVEKNLQLLINIKTISKHLSSYLSSICKADEIILYLFCHVKKSITPRYSRI